MLTKRPVLEEQPDPLGSQQDIVALIELKLKMEMQRRRKYGLLAPIDPYYIPDWENTVEDEPMSKPHSNGQGGVQNGDGPHRAPSLFDFLDSDLSIDLEAYIHPQSKPVVIGFNPERLKNTRYDPSCFEKMPQMSANFTAAFVERKMRESSGPGKMPRDLEKRLPEIKPLNKDPQLQPSKPKKSEYSIVTTPRMSIFERKRVKVSKDDASQTLVNAQTLLPTERRILSKAKLVTLTGDQIAAFRVQMVQERYEDAVAAVIKNQRFFQRGDFESNLAKLASYAAKFVRKTTIKTKKNDKDFAVRAKKLHREMLVYWKRRNKEMNELRKKKEKLELEMRKKEEERAEQENQKKRIEYLITQSVFYAQIMANKLGTQTDPKVATDQLIALGEEDKRNAQASVMDIIRKDKQRVAELDEKQHRQTGQGEINQAQMDRANFDFSNVDLTSNSKLVDIPAQFHGTLKEYQLKGLRWLDNLYEQGINGILADEMGLGKTIQALALMAHISERKDNWGPFLVIAPATTLFNWHNEAQRFCPHLKVLPYWGSLKERKSLRRYLQQQYLGRRDCSFHIVITSYQIAVIDERILQRLNWSYIVLDEAQAIKNIKGQRWNTLLSLRSRNKLLLTGTPIQNTMAELWALLHFIMPKLFDSHEQFQEWFSKDIEAHSQNKARLDQTQLNRLHAILKPFMLRRVKKDVEKEIGQKHEYEILCKLTPRQQILYDKIRSKINLADFFALKENKEKAKNLMNLVMQFRKVCNHPDLFERKMVRSGYVFSRRALVYEPPGYLLPNAMDVIRADEYQSPLCVRTARVVEEFQKDSLTPGWGAHWLMEAVMTAWQFSGQSRLALDFWYQGDMQSLAILITHWHYAVRFARKHALLNLEDPNFRKTTKAVVRQVFFALHPLKESVMDLGSVFIERVLAQAPKMIATFRHLDLSGHFWRKVDVLTPKMEFPTFVSLILDSSKLTYLDTLLLQLKSANKRCLIFCQMTKMMDILEEFLQWRQYHYFRLDGSCNLAARRDMVGEYQRNSDIFVFLLSTRAGGLGVTLTAADVVIFYDNDWNPTMDAQAADRAHRIGRTEDVDVYRLISKDTIEDKIVKRAQQKKTVQQTVYSGEALKGTVFRSNELLKILIDEKGPAPPKEHKHKPTTSHPKRTGRDAHHGEQHPREESQPHKKQSGVPHHPANGFNLEDFGKDFDIDFGKELDDLLGDEE
jgi:DNA helicase INO80